MAPEVMEQVSFSSLRFVQSDYGWTVGLVDQGSRPGISHVFIVLFWRMFCSSSSLITCWRDASYHLLQGEMFLYIMYVRKEQEIVWSAKWLYAVDGLDVGRQVLKHCGTNTRCKGIVRSTLMCCVSVVHILLAVVEVIRSLNRLYCIIYISVSRKRQST
jgi:hypothetical protein